ncbi:MAG: YtxH domain-containing protein [Bacteroidota bacterium]
MSKSSRSFWAFLLGAATGATIGILYAPDKGENTRDKLAFQLQKYRDQLKSLIEELVDGNEMPESMAKSESKKVVSDARQKAERLLSDVESLMGQIKSKS